MEIELPSVDGRECSIRIMDSLPDDIACTDEIFNRLLSRRPQEHGKVRVFDKEYNVPRYIMNYGMDYFFSGLSHKSDDDMDEYLARLLSWVCKHSGKEYNQMLVNWYMDGRDHIGPHSDDERQLVPDSDIYSFSFGATRDFVVKGKYNDHRSVYEMKNNTLIIMRGCMQKFYKHSVPKRLKVKEPRINVTMRLFATHA